jgi:hypothetical protein
MKNLILYFPCTSTLLQFRSETRTNGQSISNSFPELKGYFTPKELQTALRMYGAYVIDETGPRAREISIL